MNKDNVVNIMKDYYSNSVSLYHKLLHALLFSKMVQYITFYRIYISILSILYY